MLYFIALGFAILLIIIVVAEFRNSGYLFSSGDGRKPIMTRAAPPQAEDLAFYKSDLKGVEKDVQEFTNFRIASLNILLEKSCTGDIERAQNLYCILTALEENMWPEQKQKIWEGMKELELWGYFTAHIKVSMGLAVFQDKVYLKRSAPELSIHYKKDTGILVIDEWNTTINVKSYFPGPMAIRIKKMIETIPK